ncbi:MAG: TIGR03085 family metal-binding protein [Propionibacteriaceae bacterium]|nr:TIGR03085 family metal-binding protein [Propionibacteriaceae bacterium]
MGFAKDERRALCDALLEVGPEAPTLCEGWDAHDLAVHVWIRENDPLAVSGAFIKPLAGLTESRSEAIRKRWMYAELVDRIRRGPGLVSPFALPGVDELANTGEFFVHTEDVRRPAGLSPRDMGADFEEYVAKSLATMAKPLMRDASCGIVFERTDVPETLRVKPGGSTVTVAGKPSELLLFAFGRMADADVELIGEPATLAKLTATHRGF